MANKKNAMKCSMVIITAATRRFNSNGGGGRGFALIIGLPSNLMAGHNLGTEYHFYLRDNYNEGIVS